MHAVSVQQKRLYETIFECLEYQTEKKIFINQIFFHLYIFSEDFVTMKEALQIYI